MISDGHQPGHCYLLESQCGTALQIIQFIEKAECKDKSKPLVTVFDGTTNEEVLRALIDRLQHLQARMACRENSIAITKLEEALMCLEKRTADRKARRVEGTEIK